MDRQILDSLYLGAPHRAFSKALANFDEQSFSFLRDHAEELDADLTIELLNRPLAEGMKPHIEPFIRRLGKALNALLDQPRVTPGPPFSVAGVGATIRALDLAEHVHEDAWADLTVRLRGHPPQPLWYSFVDRVRGGEVFNALNEPPPNVDPKDFLGPLATNRREPFVVPLLEERTHEAKAAAYVLTLPMNVILRVHDRIPNHVLLDDVRRVVAGRVTASEDRWSPPLPDWMAPFVAERLGHCSDEEALELYKWLAEQPADAHGANLFEIGVARFKLRPLSWGWHPLIGRQLATGKAWKTRGRPVIEFCVDYNKGFSPQLLTAALEGAGSKDGADKEEHRAAILRSIHDLAARVFIERADAALKRADWEWGRRLLKALTCLDPGSFISPALHYLRGVPNVPDDVVGLIGSCEELAHLGGRVPSEDAFHEAFLVLSGSVA